MKSHSMPPDGKGRKFIIFFCGKPVYEGDETHQHMERCRIEFGGDFMKMAQFDARVVEEQSKKIFR
jgi:hypothetical protein